MKDRTPYQDKIIKRYYQNFDAIKFQRLYINSGPDYLNVLSNLKLFVSRAILLQPG